MWQMKILLKEHLILLLKIMKKALLKRVLKKHLILLLAFEDLVAPPLEEHTGEDSSHISNEDQARKETMDEETPQIHEKALYPPMEDHEEDLDEDFDGESPRTSISLHHEVEGLASFG
jgi:hypothetical protein